MSSNSNNIYKTPSADLESSDSEGVLNFKRFSAWGVFGLSIITLGIYPIYWLYSRSKAANSFHHTKISTALLNSLLITTIASFAIGFFVGFSGSNAVPASLDSVVNILYIILYLIALYTFRARLKEITNTDNSVVITFFANVIYMQYKINEAIDEKTATED